jgi:murein DD-endopeptidase MepM/ murein hydrolase activator NlpD
MVDKINPWKMSTIILALVLISCISWYLLKDYEGEDETAVAPTHVAESDQEYSEHVADKKEVPPEQPPIRKVSTVNKGDSFYKILQENGIAQRQAHDILMAAKEVFDLSKVLPSHELVLVFSADNQNLIELDYEISDHYRLNVTVDEEDIQAQKIKVERILQSTYNGVLEQKDFTIKKGDNLYDILHKSGIGDYQIDLIVKSVKKVHNLSDIVPGQTMSIWVTLETPVKLARLTYEIDGLNFLEVKPDNGSFKAKKHTLEVEVHYERAEGSISSSLYESAIQAGVSPEVVMDLTDIFAWDINFFTEIRVGDMYTVLYEKYYVGDTFKGYGRVIAARFINQGQEHVAVYFDDGSGIRGYYDDQGKPIQKLFLKAPLNYRRISSGFSYNRMHPVYHKRRPHLGVDYAAPTGTPVVALGDGKVILKGWSNGFGHTIRIKHRNNYVTYYGHFSRYAKGMKKNKQVSQGQVIGYVGQTGVATGPHLDFRVRYNGKFINPLKLKSVTGPPLKGKTLAAFKDIATKSLAMLVDPALNIAVKLSKTD